MNARPTDSDHRTALESRLDELKRRRDAQLMYTVEEVATLTRLGRTTIYDEIRAGRLKAVHIGRSRRVTAAALEAFVASLSAAS